MMNRLYRFSLLGLICFAVQMPAQNMHITSITPQKNQNNVSRNADITISFDQDISGSTLNNSTVIIRGSQTGKLSGVYSGAGSTTIIFNPDNDFRLGEIISVTITTALMSNSGLHLARGHSYSFTVVSGLPPSSPPIFAQRNISGAGSGGRDLKVIDFDRDGDLDILSGNEGVPEQIFLFENDGNLNFCPFNTGGNFRNVEVYDIDRDGDYDTFGATGAFDTELNWFENEGSFPLTERFISSEDPWTLAGGDLDSDGDIDVVAAVILPNRILWFANDGAGNFSSAMSIPTTFGGGSDSYFYIRDINSDGAMDILAFHRDDFNLVWYQNDGNQNFTEIVIANTPNRMRPNSADIDGDGDIDIVAVSTDNSPSSPISWFENNGSENFTEHPITATSTGRLFTVSVTDLDGDQDMDILAGGYWFENDGSENFAEFTISDGLTTGTNYFANGINHADVDEDGDMDILTLGLYTLSWQENSHIMDITATTPLHANVSTPADGSISITFDQPIEMATVNNNNIKIFSQFRGVVSGTFSAAGTNTITFDPVSDFSPGDFIEVSVTERVLSLSGHGLAFPYGFSFQIKTSAVSQPVFTPYPVITHTDNATGLDVADMDGDGDLDLLSCSFTELYWHQNDGSGNFTVIPITTTGTPVAVFAFDQNEDGHMDIWIDNSGFAGSMLYTNDGNQNFTESQITGSLQLKQLTDVNHDGDMDIVYLSNSNNWVVWGDYKCGGYGGYGSMPHSNNRDVQADDMDNDGDTDFIAASTLGPISYENNDHFIFSDHYFDANSTGNLTISDLDSDGDLDPIFTENFSAIIWYENISTGDSLNFGGRQEIALLNMDPRDVIAVDIDGDGDADIAAVSRNDDKVVWYENRLNEPSADFGPEQLGVTIADGPSKIQSGDLDADGDMDLVTLSDNDDELIWFKNNGNAVGIDEDDRVVPLVFRLHQNYPNPFNPSTVISWQLAVSSNVSLSVFDLTGKKVATLVNEKQSAGSHQIEWVASDLASGVYMYRLEAGSFVQTRKTLLLR